MESAYAVVARRKNASAPSSLARWCAIYRRSQLLHPPDLITSRDQQPAQRSDVDVEDHLRRRSQRMDGCGSGYEGTYYEDASTFGPWMIIKHSTHSIDQLRQAFSAVRRGMRIVQPGV